MSVTYRVTQMAKDRYSLNGMYFVGIGAFVKETEIRYDDVWFSDGWFMIV